MSNDDQGVIHSASQGGVIGQHPESEVTPFLVGSTTGTETNTFRFPPVPILCWKVEDIRFAFDSSFVTCNPDNSPDPLTNPDDPTSDPLAKPFIKPLGDIRDELKLLASQIKQNPGCPLAVFGHADPVGPAVDPDGYNKALSGRRATAIYALLISGTQLQKAAGLWQTIATNPNEHWGASQSQVMQTLTGLPAGTSMSDLISGYLPKILPPEFVALNIGPENFLAQGSDAQGKGDYQGCSSFNPLLIFSQQKEDSFAPGADDQDPAVYAARNLANAPNRRVMVLIFTKGSKVDPTQWPCPSTSGDKSGCIKRFWSDGQTRRSTRLPDEDRKFDDKKDTFACRFYQRLLVKSPCEKILRTFEIRLYDPRGRFIADAPFTFAAGSQSPVVGTADSEGILTVFDVQVPARCHLTWGYKPDEGEQPNLVFSLDMYLTIDSASREKEASEKLHNLGYPNENELTENVTQFQKDYGQLNDPALTVDGVLDDATLNLIRDTYQSCEDDLRNMKPTQGQGQGQGS